MFGLSVVMSFPTLADNEKKTLLDHVGVAVRLELTHDRSTVTNALAKVCLHLSDDFGTSLHATVLKEVERTIDRGTATGT